MYPRTRKDALKMGNKFYKTNKPCNHGHIDKRYTSSKGCYACVNDKKLVADNNAKKKEQRENNWLQYMIDRKDREYKRLYGINFIQYRNLCMIDDYCCAICGEPERFMDEKDWKKKGYLGTLHVDHCHETGRVRGVLCKTCNMALGMNQLSYFLTNAGEYLSRRGTEQCT